MRKHIFEGKFGLERETLRIDKKGRLARRYIHLMMKICQGTFAKINLK